MLFTTARKCSDIVCYNPGVKYDHFNWNNYYDENMCIAIYIILSIILAEILNNSLS